jgi:hypothetical protein
MRHTRHFSHVQAISLLPSWVLMAACAVMAHARATPGQEISLDGAREPPRVLQVDPGAEPTAADHTDGAESAGPVGSSMGIEEAQYLEDSILHQDPAQEAQLRALVDEVVAARLAGIPRPRYIPMTDLAPPKGLLLLKNDSRRGEFPFAMALGGFLQLRWLEFARDATQWTNSAGRTLPVNNIDSFNINRFLLSFTGHVVDDRLLYFFALFGTSNVGIRSGVVPIGMVGWKFSEAATVGGGVTIVPGSREWVDQTAWRLGIDGSMANTFFRPSYSPGVLAQGSVFDESLHYRAGVWNAIDGGSSGVLRRGTSMAWAGNTWWEPLGNFGFGYSDMEHHDDAVIRLGTSGVYALSYSLPIQGGNPEDTIVRLSDGTPLTLRGALGTDTQVDRFRYRLATVDAGWKWRGIGLNFEYYFRGLDDFTGDGPFNTSSMFDHGGLGYLSWCFVPRTYEAYARSSAITGPYGTGQEYGGGLNWYLKKSRQARLTLEALYMNRNPAQNFLYPYRAGYTGTAIQTQLFVMF